MAGLTVEREGSVIHVESEMLLAAPRASVFRVLSDYDRFSRLSSRYKESRFTAPSSDGTQRVYTRIEGCVLFFCRTVERYARLETDAPDWIRATVEPENSDFKYGLETWQLKSSGDGTRVFYTHDFDPGFWVPPLLGIWAIRRALESDALTAAQRIEALSTSEGKP